MPLLPFSIFSVEFFDLIDAKIRRGFYCKFFLSYHDDSITKVFLISQNRDSLRSPPFCIVRVDDPRIMLSEPLTGFLDEEKLFM